MGFNRYRTAFSGQFRGALGISRVDVAPALPAVIAAQAWSQPVWALLTGGTGPAAEPVKTVAANPLAGMAEVTTTDAGTGRAWKTVTITAPDLVVDGYLFSDTLVVIRAPRVVLRNCVVLPPQIVKNSPTVGEIVNSSYAITLANGYDTSDSVIEYCRIDGQGGRCNTAVYFGNGAARAEVRYCRAQYLRADGYKVLSSLTGTDRPKLHHNLLTRNGFGYYLTHDDMISVDLGGAEIYNNLFDMREINHPTYGINFGPDNAVRMQANTVGEVRDVSIYDNVMIGGETVASFALQSSNDRPAANIRIGRNIIQPNVNGYIAHTVVNAGVVEFGPTYRYPDGAAIATPATQPGGITLTLVADPIPDGQAPGTVLGQFTIVDVNNNGTTVTLTDNAGGTLAVDGSNRLIAGLTAINTVTMPTLTFAATAQDADGRAMPWPVTFTRSTTPGALGSIAVDSGALRMPDGNYLASATGLPAVLQDAANWAPAGNKIFAAGNAFAIMVEVPWEALPDTNAMAICGNAGSATYTTALSNTLGIYAKRGLTDADPFYIQFVASDNATVRLTGQIAVTRAQKRLLCVMRMDAGQMRFEVYHAGVLVGSVAPAMGAFASYALGSQLSYGGMGNRATSGLLSSGSLTGFIGSIAFVGLANTGGVQGDYEVISAGGDPLTQIAAANWRMYRRLTDTSATSLTKPAAATADATAPMVVANSRGLSFLRGSDLVAAASGVTRFAVAHVLDGVTVAALPGATSGTIRLSGTATGLTGGVQIRVFDAATGQLRLDWTTLAGADLASGAWSGSVVCPVNSGWGHYDLRPTLAPAMVQRVRARTGVGIVSAIIAQSEMTKTFEATQANIAVAGGGALAMVEIQNRAAGNFRLMIHPITAERRKSDGMAGLANWLPAHTTRPMFVANLTFAGKNVAQLVDDTETVWQWSEFETVLANTIGALSTRVLTAAVINSGSDFAIATGLNAGGYPTNVDEYIRPLVEGARGPYAVGTFPINHFVRDGLTFPLSMGLGFLPPGRYTEPAAGPLDNSYGNAQCVQIGYGRRGWKYYRDLNPSIAYGPEMPDLQGDVTTGGAHPATTSDAYAREAVYFGETVLRAAGISTRTNPAISGATINVARTEITVTVTRPNGGNLQTAWANRGVAVPSGEQTVQGFEVQNGGVGSFSRSGFTAEILDAAAGTVKLTKTAGAWAAGTKVSFMANSPMGWGRTPEAGQIILGCLHETASDNGGLGLPVGGWWEAVI